MCIKVCVRVCIADGYDVRVIEVCEFLSVRQALASLIEWVLFLGAVLGDEMLGLIQEGVVGLACVRAQLLAKFVRIQKPLQETGQQSVLEDLLRFHHVIRELQCVYEIRTHREVFVNRHRDTQEGCADRCANHNAR
jgi:hypothetical protein